MSILSTDWKNNQAYFNMLQLIGQLSNLFSESNIPYIQYRMAENIFCKYFNADNLSRSDISYDAVFNNKGIGIKTFQLKNEDSSIEKIAEFNALSSELHKLKALELARRVSQLRNERITLAETLCDTNSQLYHIVGRKEHELIIFNTPYESIDIDNICDVRNNKDKSVRFNDGKNEYTFNFSKSVLMKRFQVSQDNKSIPIQIIEDPYSLLEKLFVKNKEFISPPKPHQIVLPLYSERNGGYVPLKSGLNQWNAGGRKRDENEVYIPIPKKIHQYYPDFFPSRDTPFNLHLPSKRIISAKLCQDGSKALMSNPNKDLGVWLLREIMKLPVGQVATMNDLKRLGFDSLLITKISNTDYKISLSYSKSFSDFIE